MGKAQRDKGKRGERLVVNSFRTIFPLCARDLNDVYAERGIDIANTGNLAIQVKHYQNHVPMSKIKEVKTQGEQIPVLVSWPTNREEQPLVCLPLADFIKILQNTGVIYG